AMTFLTEVTSNTATTALMLPVLGGAALALEVDPRLLMLPATYSASCAFMLPIATPPNAIVFSSGRISMAEMAKVGVVINLVGVVLITLAVWFFMVPAMDIDVGAYPDWARNLQGP
ncbi:MAG: SLC13 family permease, partial [Myxococcota bacterium]